MNTIRTCFNKVKDILEEYPSSRNNDNTLFYIYLSVYHKVNQDTLFTDVLQGIEQGFYPSFETLRRSRQKVQENYPDLKASKEVQEARKQQEILIREQIKLI